MYKFNIDIDYHNYPEEQKDFQYKKQLLEVFNTNYENIIKINEIQCLLYNKYCNNESLNEVLEFFKNNQTIIPLELSLETCFIFLFSYDYFYLLHKCLQDIHKYNKITKENIENIYFLIKKK